MSVKECAIHGYPRIVRLVVRDTGTASPATILVDFVAVRSESEPLRRSLLRVRTTRPSAVATWDVFAVGTPRPLGVNSGIVRCKFHDFRCRFANVLMPNSYNTRDSEGQVDDDDKKTIQELWQIIAQRTGANISVDSTPAEFHPPAAWAGKTAAEAANELLEYTGSRMLYDPVNVRLVVAWSGSTTPLNLNGRIAKQPPSPVWNKLEAFSRPTLYDGAVNCRMVWVDDDGNQEPMADLEDDDSLKNAFLGFPDVSDAKRRNRLVQSAFRVWKPIDVSHPEEKGYPGEIVLADHRGVVIGGSPEEPVFESIKVLDKPGEQHSLSGPAGQGIRHQERLKLVTSDRAVVACDDAGEVQTDVKFIAAYHIRDEEYPYGLESLKEERNLQGAGTAVKRIIVPAIRPIDSDQPDGPSAGDWQDLLGKITDAIKPMVGGTPHYASIPTWILPKNWGRTAEIKWSLAMSPRVFMHTGFLIDSSMPGEVSFIGANE